MHVFHVYEDLRGEWRWRMVSRNGRVIADSAEGYDSHSGAHAAVERLIAGVNDGECAIVRD